MAGELRLYDVTVGGHKTRMRLNDADAARLGDLAKLISQRPAPAAIPPPAEGKARLTTSNKMRGTAEPSE